MKKTVLAAGLLAASSAFASDFTGAYIGLQGGASFNSFEGKTKKTENQSTESATGDISQKTFEDKTSYGVGFIAGYAFETGEDALAALEVRGSSSFHGKKEATKSNKIVISEKYSFGFAGLAGYQLENLFPYAKLGFSYTVFNGYDDDTMMTTIKEETKSNDTKAKEYKSFGIDFGVGAKFAATDSLQIGIDYTGSYLFDKDLKGFNKHNVNLGITYRFDM